MRAPSYTHQFKKDVRRMVKQGKDPVKIKAVMTSLVEEEPLTESYRDHMLAGSYKDRRECHIERRRAGIRPDETEQFKRMAKYVLALSGAQLDALIDNGRFEEVAAYDEAVPK